MYEYDFGPCCFCLVLAEFDFSSSRKGRK